MTRIPSRRTALTAAVGLTLVAGLAAMPTASADPAPVRLQLLSFNDYHGNLLPPDGSPLGPKVDPSGSVLGGSEYLASTLSSLRAGVENSLTVAAGDNIGGSTFLSGLFHDEPSVDSLEAMHLDVTSVGNHEFDEGVDELLRMQYGGCHPTAGCYFPDQPYDGADFPWLAANVVYKPGNSKGIQPGTPVLPGTWVRKVGNIKVGFIGMTLEGTPELVAQTGIADVEFRDEVETANRAASWLRETQGVRAIVVLVHEGGFQTGQYSQCTGISGPIVSIAQNLDPSIDAVVTGHTHQPYVCSIPDPAGQPRTVTSASSFGRVVTETWLTLDRRTKDVVRSQTTSVNHLVLRTTPDPALTAIIAKWQALSAPIAGRIVGRITADITGSVKDTNRDKETSLQNLIADAQLEATASPANGGSVIALMNSGGVRDNLFYAGSSAGEGDGNVTYGEAFNVQPFGNLLVSMDLSGAKLQEALEQMYVGTRSRKQLFLGISNGLTFDWLQGNPEGSKVPNDSVRLNGVPIVDTQVYRVTVNNFLAAGGDGFTAFLAGTNRVGGGDDLDAFAAYLGANSPVSPPPTNRVNEL